MNKKHGKKGFTLIEIIISLAILSIVILSVLGAFTNGFSSIMAMGKKTKAVERSKKIVDTIIYKESATGDFLYKIFTDDSDSTFTNSAIAELNSGITDGIVLSSIKASVADLTAPGGGTQANYNTINQKLYKVTITVSYDNGTKSTTLTSLVPQGGNL